MDNLAAESIFYAFKSNEGEIVVITRKPGAAPDTQDTNDLEAYLGTEGGLEKQLDLKYEMMRDGGTQYFIFNKGTIMYDIHVPRPGDDQPMALVKLDKGLPDRSAERKRARGAPIGLVSLDKKTAATIELK